MYDFDYQIIHRGTNYFNIENIQDNALCLYVRTSLEALNLFKAELKECGTVQIYFTNSSEQGRLKRKFVLPNDLEREKRDQINEYLKEEFG